MSRTYRLQNVASDLSLGGAFTHILNAIASGTDSVTASSGGGVQSGYYAAPTDDPSSGGISTGSFTVVLNVSAASSSTQARCYLLRVNSAGVTQAEVVSPDGYISTATTGDKTWSWTSPALGTWAAGDRLVVRVEVQNNNTHGGSAGPTFNLAATNTRVNTPFPNVLARSAALDAVCVVDVAAFEFFAVLQAAISVDAVADIASSGTVTPGGPPTHERSAALDAVCGIAATFVPRKVTGLTATPISQTQIDLSWDTVIYQGGGYAYDIERDGTVIVRDHPTTSYSDTGLTAATQYTYRVRAVR